MRRVLDMHRLTRRDTGQKGAVLVEMAFALPLLALILLNIIDLGLMVREHQVLQNAAREAARFSALPANQIAFSTDPSGTLYAIKQKVIEYCAREKITVVDADITVIQDYAIPLACGSEITVTYTRPLLLLGVPFLPTGSFTLTGRSVFHNLYGC